MLFNVQNCCCGVDIIDRVIGSCSQCKVLFSCPIALVCVPCIVYMTEIGLNVLVHSLTLAKAEACKDSLG